MAAGDSILCKDGSFAVLFPVARATSANLGYWLIMAIPEKGVAQGEPDYEIILVKDWRSILPQGDGNEMAALIDALVQGGASLYPHATVVAATTSRNGEELLVKYGPMSGPNCTWEVQGNEGMEVIGAIQKVEQYLVNTYPNVTHKVCQPNTVAPQRTTV